MFPPFIEKLRSQLLLPLPGVEAQYKLAPYGRLIYELPDIVPLNPNRGSVLILLYPHGADFKVIYIKRTEYKGVHSGQVSFPGGKFEAADLTLEVTAIRETREEIGVGGEEIEIIGRLTELYISPSNFLVSPFIGFVQEKPVFQPDPREVETIIETSLSGLKQAFEKLTEKQITTSEDITITAPFFEVSGFHIWGVTAMISSEFIEIVKEIG